MREPAVHNPAARHAKDGQYLGWDKSTSATTAEEVGRPKTAVRARTADHSGALVAPLRVTKREDPDVSDRGGGENRLNNRGGIDRERANRESLEGAQYREAKRSKERGEERVNCGSG